MRDPVLVLRGAPACPGPVKAVTVDTRGRWVIFARGDGRLERVALADGSTVAAANLSRDWIRAMVVSPDGGLIAAGDEEGWIRLLRPDPLEVVAAWPAHRGPVYGLAFVGPERLASAGDDRWMRIWPSPRWTCTARWRLPGIPLSLAGILRPPWLAVGLDDGRVALGDGSGTSPRLVPCAPDAVMSLAFSGGGQRLAAGDRTGTVHVLRLPEAVVERRLRAFDGPVFGVAMAPDGPALMAAGRSLKVFHLSEGGAEEHTVPTGWEERVLACALAADGRPWVAGGWDGRVLAGTEG